MNVIIIIIICNHPQNHATIGVVELEN